MWMPLETNQLGQELYRAGMRVPPGLYVRIENQRQITLPHEDFLPASLDGRIAHYIRVLTWHQLNPPADLK